MLALQIKLKSSVIWGGVFLYRSANYTEEPAAFAFFPED
jgi:hypothetical protein